MCVSTSYLPHEDAVVYLDDFHSVPAVVAELERLANDEAAYFTKLLWKKKPLDKLSTSRYQLSEPRAAAEPCR